MAGRVGGRGVAVADHGPVRARGDVAGALGAGTLAAVAWLVGGPILGLTAGPFGIAVGLAVAYGRMAHGGEYGALLHAGIPPRRVGAAAVACALVIALVEAAIACAYSGRRCAPCTRATVCRAAAAAGGVDRAAGRRAFA